ncbi:MAG: glycosyltransferase family 4 protein [bacterium]|nr:glycosyltransferase family 4 protein [bacterium]
MRAPRVLLDALLVNRRPTGVGRSILELTRALAERDRGLDFLVATTTPEMFAFLEGVPRWRVVTCPGARGGVLRKALYTQFALPGLCRRLGADILHSLQFVAPLRLSCPSVVTVHDLAWQLFPDTVEQPRRTYYRLLVPPTLRRAHTVVTNSAATATDVGTLHPAAADRIQVTPFGTPSWVWESPGAGEPPTAAVGERPRFLFVGTMEPRKNLEGLLTAYEVLLARTRAAGGREADCPALHFVGGAGWRDSLLRRRISDLRERGHLAVEDYCEPAVLWERYRSALALVFPSVHEGFGFPILEAMAAGLPVLTANRGAMAEVAGDAAQLVDPDDAEDLADGLAALAVDGDLRGRLRTQGFAQARIWQWERTADATVAVYRQVLDQAATG